MQTYTRTAYLGRVISINHTQNGLSSMISFPVVLGAQAIGVRYAVVTTAVLLFGVGTLYRAFSWSLRRLA